MIRFIKEPPGKFRPRYTVGGTARFDKGREFILIQKGYAVEISEKTDKGDTGRLLVDDTPIEPRQDVPDGDKRGNGPRRRNNRSN